MAPVLRENWSAAQAVNHGGPPGKVPDGRSYPAKSRVSGGGNATTVEPSLAPEVNLAAQHTVFGPI